MTQYPTITEYRAFLNALKVVLEQVSKSIDMGFKKSMFLGHKGIKLEIKNKRKPHTHIYKHTFFNGPWVYPIRNIVSIHSKYRIYLVDISYLCLNIRKLTVILFIIKNCKIIETT